MNKQLLAPAVALATLLGCASGVTPPATQPGTSLGVSDTPQPSAAPTFAPGVGRHLEFSALSPEIQAFQPYCDSLFMTCSERAARYEGRIKSGVWQVVGYDLTLKDPLSKARETGGWSIRLVLEEDETITVNGVKETKKREFAKNRWSKEYFTVWVEECLVYRESDPSKGTRNFPFIPSLISDSRMEMGDREFQLQFAWVSE